MKKNKKLWSFALAGALAVSNLSAVAMPMAGIVAQAKKTQDTQATAYVKSVTMNNAPGNFGLIDAAASQYNVDVVVATGNDWDLAAGINGSAAYAALPKGDKRVAEAYELIKGGKVVYSNDIVAAQNVTINLNLGGTGSAATTKVDDVAGDYTIRLYYGAAATTPGANKGALTKSDGLTAFKDETFKICKVTTTSKDGSKTAKYLVLEGEDLTVPQADQANDGTPSENGVFTLGSDEYDTGAVIKNITADMELKYKLADGDTGFDTNDIKYILGFDDGTANADDETTGADGLKSDVAVMADARIGGKITLPDLSHFNGLNGMVFVGWSKKTDGSNLMKAGDSYTVSEGVAGNVLYGIWKPGYVIQPYYYAGPGGTITLDGDPIVVEKDKSVSLPDTSKGSDVAAYAASAFAGWAKTAAEVGKPLDGDETTKFTDNKDLLPGATVAYSVTDQSKVKAAFTSAKLAIAAGAMLVPTVNSGNSKDVFNKATMYAVNTNRVGDAVEAGYKTFTAIFVPGYTISFANDTTANYITSAQYKKANWDNTATGQYDASDAAINLGALGAGATINYGDDLDAAELLKMSDAELAKAFIQKVPQNGTITLNKNIFKSEKYNFVGWATTADAAKGIVSFKDGQTITVGDKVGSDLPGTEVLHAVWEPKEEFDIYYISNRPGEGSQYSVPSGTDHSYGSNPYTIYKNDASLADITVWSLTGYTLSGWSESAAATTPTYKLGQENVTITKNMTLYAVWTANGGKTDASTDKKADDSSQATTPTTGIKAGETKKVSNITYKAQTDGTSVQVTKTPNKKTVTIKKTVKINDKTYKVTKIGAKAVTGKNVKNVTIDATNIKKANNINISMFKGAKNLTKVTIKGAKKNSAVAKRIVKAAQKVNKNVKIVYK